MGESRNTSAEVCWRGSSLPNSEDQFPGSPKPPLYVPNLPLVDSLSTLFLEARDHNHWIILPSSTLFLLSCQWTSGVWKCTHHVYSLHGECITRPASHSSIIIFSPPLCFPNTVPPSISSSFQFRHLVIQPASYPLPSHITIHPFTILLIHLSIHPSIHLPIPLSSHSSIHPSTHHLSIYPSFPEFPPHARAYDENKRYTCERHSP